LARTGRRYTICEAHDEAESVSAKMARNRGGPEDDRTSLFSMPAGCRKGESRLVGPDLRETLRGGRLTIGLGKAPTIPKALVVVKILVSVTCAVAPVPDPAIMSVSSPNCVINGRKVWFPTSVFPSFMAQR
jgi:hypothetical protein